MRRDSQGRITTGPLNRLVQSVLSANPPPIRSGKRFKILYATQLEPHQGSHPGAPLYLLRKRL